jgi:helicase required for RNAi-mediated heterochromatin assembly 1
MITRNVSIVQGPPGTGKTFTSVSALKVLVKNLDNNSPPIVIAAQTNHALDQLLKHVLNFEPDVLRMGTRSDKENVAIQQRTLHTLRSSIRGVPNLFKGMKPVMKLLEKVQQEIQALVDPLVVGNIISEEVLLDAGLITAAQKDSLCESDGGDEWACGDQGKSAQHGSPLERCRCFHILNVLHSSG